MLHGGGCGYLNSTVDLGYFGSHGNVKVHDRHNTKIHATQLHRSNPHLYNPSSSNTSTNTNTTVYTTTNKPWNPNNVIHGTRASTWCCGSFVVKQLRKTHHFD